MSHRDDSSTEGFAAVDALVALVILATTLALSLTAVETSMRASRSAEELRFAQNTLRYAIETGGRTVANTAGESAAFTWRVRSESLTLAASLFYPCKRTAEAVSRRSGKSYHLTTISLCEAA